MRVRAFLAYLLAVLLAVSGLAVGSATAAHAADPVPVTGIVVDATTFEGVGGADVEAAGPTNQAVTTDADGAYAMQLLPGLYDLSAVADGYQTGSASFEVTAETTTLPDLELTPDLSCQPAAASQGLSNMGFESGLDGWTLGYQTESIQAVGADQFTAPWEGTGMARLGESKPSNGESQPEGPNVMCQDFVVTDPQEAFAFNVFTYDYTGFDEFMFDVVVSNPDTGETLAAYRQGSWGEGTELKTSGWRGVKLDLADHVGDTLRLTFRSGGTSDSLYAFWAYLDSAETLPPTITLPTTAVQTDSGSVTSDPVTGQTTISMPFGDPSDVTITLPAECDDPTATPTSVSLLLNGNDFPGTSVGNGKFTVTIPEASIASGILNLQVVCEGETTVVVPIGQIVLYDPSGIVSDAVTGAPVVGAEVSLFKVPGWTPQGDTGPYPANSCQTNLSKEPGAPWTQLAPTDLGVLVNAASPEISPNVNPFVTNSAGYYGWDVAEGCWYVEVSAKGYAPLTSPVVGVPTAVTDLDLNLEPTALGAAPTATTAPALSGTPKVGSTLTVSNGTWSVPGLTFAYEWQRAGVAIAGATAATYTVTKADVGKALTARVKATKVGYAEGVATTAPLTGQVADSCVTAQAELANATAAVTKAQAVVTKATTKVKKLKKKLKAAIKKAKADPGKKAFAKKVTKLKKKLKKAKKALRKAKAALASAVTTRDAAAAKVAQLC